MKTIILASNNKNKIEEIKEILGSDYDIKSLKEIGFNEEIEETGTTFEENALIKAKAIYDIYKIPCIADDSGLEVDALNKAPGVYSHRYAGLDQNDDNNNKLLIKNLNGIENRKANYYCALCYYDKIPIYASAKCDGLIIDIPRGNNGFGYDPYFFIPSLNKTMAELTLEEKNKISHRRKALDLLKVKLNELHNNI